MKKILVITPFFYPHVGGSQKYMEEIYAFLLEKHNDIEVDVLCYNTANLSKATSYRGINIYRISCLKILENQFYLPNPVSLLSFLYKKRNDYSLIHCSTRFFDSSWWAPIYAKLVKKKIMLTDHCASHPIHKSLFVSKMAKYVDLYLVKLFLRFYTQIFVTNKAAQNFLKNKFSVRSKLVYGGVDSGFYRCPKRFRKKNLKITYIGRMIKSKGVVDLFNVVKNLKNVEFNFAGPGELNEVLKKELVKNRIRNIKILGELDKKQVARLLSLSDIFVHPSFHHEGFPNALLEAGASRLAIIATDVGGTKEIIINGKTGILIQPKDQKVLKENLEKLIKDSKLRDRLASNLYNHVRKNFDWKKISEEFYQILKKSF